MILLPMLPLLKNDPIRKKITWKGINLDIEWPKGSIRKYENSPFRKKMLASYGYIRNTDSVDGEEVDVYINEKGLEKADKVYKITQLKDPIEGKGGKPWTFDEYKYMLGFKSSKEAKSTYIKCMTKKHFGKIEELTVYGFLRSIKRNINKNS
jgi:hypothetical protein